MAKFNPKARGQGITNFNPATDIPSLEGKVIFISGGTGGLGAESAKALAARDPAHIYISGRNRKSAEALIASIQRTSPKAQLTFVELDLSSLASVKEGVKKYFKHSRLDILMCNAGIMAQPATLSKDGYEIQFATNHLGHAMLIRSLLPTLLSTANQPDSDVRIISSTSLGYGFRPPAGISFSELDAHSPMKRLLMGGWVRYGHSKIANILYASALAAHYPSITSLSIHPGVVLTELYHTQPWYNRWFIDFATWVQRIEYMPPHKGAWNQLWVAAAASKEELRQRNGGFYLPVGIEGWDTLDKMARDGELAEKLWTWTEGVLEKF